MREQRRLERLGTVRVDGASAAEHRHDRAAVVAHDAEVPEVGAQVGVVAESEERLGILGDHVGVEVLEDLDLVFAADAGQDRLDLGIGEGGVDVPGPVSGARPDPSGRVLDRVDAVLALEPPDPELEGSREHLGKGGAGGEHGDLVTGFRLLGIDHPADASWLLEIASDPVAGGTLPSGSTRRRRW